MENTMEATIALGLCRVNGKELLCRFRVSGLGSTWKFRV